MGNEGAGPCPRLAGAALSGRFFCISFTASCVLHSSLVFPDPGCSHSRHTFQTKAGIFVSTVYLKGMGSDWSTVVGSPHLWLRKWNPMQHRGWKHICGNHCRGKKWWPNSIHHCLSSLKLCLFICVWACVAIRGQLVEVSSLYHVGPGNGT